MNLEDKLKNRDINPTAIRLLVLRAILDFNQAFSLAMLEKKLETVDKSSIFRTLTIFHNKHLIHSIDDGSGSIKYSLCSDSCMCELSDLHPHFFCEECGKTFCLNNIFIPQIHLPQKFRLSTINFVLKGICDKCSSL